MMRSRKRLLIAGLLTAVLALVGLVVVQAGALYDWGQLSGTPAQANYIAWLGTAGTPPVQVVTEDNFNYPAGAGQGYSTPNWVIDVGNGFSLPAPGAGSTVNMLFGGLGTASGTLWNFNFPWDGGAANDTLHGPVATSTSGNPACPVITAEGSQTATQRTINWTGAAGTYLVYKSIQPSGAGNGHSNGRYQYVATVAGFTYLDTISVASNWYIVVRADANGNITGCHSAESSATGTPPTAVHLSAFRAEGIDAGSLTWAGAYLLGALALGAVMRKYVAGR